MKRFHLFVGDNYYPDGGAKDLQGSFDTIGEAVEHVANMRNGADWWHVLDSSTGEIVKSQEGA